MSIAILLNMILYDIIIMPICNMDVSNIYDGINNMFPHRVKRVILVIDALIEDKMVKD